MQRERLLPEPNHYRRVQEMSVGTQRVDGANAGRHQRDEAGRFQDALAELVVLAYDLPQPIGRHRRTS